MSTKQVGTKAPKIILKDSQGEEKNLENYLGNWVVLYFYPKDDTPGCTKEACSFSNALPDFKDLDAVIIGISPDSPESHRKFKEKYNLDIDLWCDIDQKAAKEFGVWGQKKMYGKDYEGVIRSTFLIDPEGNIAYAWSPVDVEGHVEEVKQQLRACQQS